MKKSLIASERRELIRLRKAHFYIDKRRSEFLTGTHWTYAVINSGRRRRKKLLRKLWKSSSLDDTSRAFHQIAGGGSALRGALTFSRSLSLCCFLSCSSCAFLIVSLCTTSIGRCLAERKVLYLSLKENVTIRALLFPSFPC